jgi:hypothetical protein
VLNNNDIQDLPNEEWVPVPKYETLYWVSNLGRIRNARKVLKFYTINSGYQCIDFTVTGVKKKNLVHRVVASAFLENSEGLPEVNHKNEDKHDNSVSNLEWCTSSHNKQHSMASGAYDKIYTLKNSLGKKHLPNTTSKYHNVGYDKARGKWRATIRHEGKNLESKRFDTEEEAALHINHLIDKYELHDRPKNIID